MAYDKNRASEREKLIDFKKIIAIIEKNFRVLIRDKTRMIPLLMFPILMILVFGYTSGNIPKHINTAIIAYDHSPLSESIQQQIAASPVFNVNHIVSTEGEGRKLLDSGDVRVLIEIPQDIQEDIDNGVQVGITIIVDESDSSVAATARQTLNSIVDRISDAISVAKISGFQQSVSSASQSLLAYDNQLADEYGPIMLQTSAAEVSLAQAKQMDDNLVSSLISTIPLPVLINPSVSSGQGRAINTDYTIVLNSPGVDKTQAQISLLRQISGLMGTAAKRISGATAIASRADAQVRQLQEYEVYNKRVASPVRKINVFTRYNPSSLQKPLLYEEKPAYGTGKRIIDFAIPSIIALTIFQGAVIGMGRAIAGEKKEGSLTRVFLTPTSNATIIAGTLSFYILFEMIRSTFLIAVSMFLFHVSIEGSLLLMALILFIYAGISTAIGMMLSSAVKTEQQFMAMAMLITMPSMFLAGAFFPVQAMPKAMQALAKVLPVTYAGEALRGVMIKGFSIGMIASPLLILLLFLGLSVAGVFAVFKRDIE